MRLQFESSYLNHIECRVSCFLNKFISTIYENEVDIESNEGESDSNCNIKGIQEGTKNSEHRHLTNRRKSKIEMTNNGTRSLILLSNVTFKLFQ